VSAEQSWVKIEEQSSNYGKFIASPLDRGFGNTLGNSLRRVLLAHLEGSAVTAIKIAGVQHEFSTLDNLKEDVLDVIMNIKGVIFSLHGESDETKVVKIASKKEGIVTAKDIILDSNIEIINPDHYIATLNKGGKLEVEITVSKGIGYLSVDIQQRNELAVGTIPVDATFSPVLKVNHTVEDCRVGKKIDYDKLVLEVWTNGSITPEDAIRASAEKLQSELVIFMEMNKKPAKKTLSVVGVEGESVDKKQQQGLKLTVEDLELSARSYNCLRKAGVETVAELVDKDIRELMKIKNFGKKSADEINDKLKQYNLSLQGDMEIEEEDNNEA